MNPIIKFTLAAVLAIAAVGIVSTAKAAEPQVCQAAASDAAAAAASYANFPEELVDAKVEEYVAESVPEEFRSRARAAILFGKSNKQHHPLAVGQRYLELCLSEKDI